MSCPKRNRQRGVALITVLIIVALVTIIATQIVSQLLLLERRAANVQHTEQAWLYALGAEALASTRLKDALKDGDKRVHLGQEWARDGFVFPVEGGQIKGRIRDASACLNLNGLLKKPGNKNNPNPNSGKGEQAKPEDNAPGGDRSQDPHQALLTRLFEQLLPDSETPPASLAAALMDWLDADSDARMPDGAEDYVYQGLTPAYRAGNGPMDVLSELRLVKGFTPEVVAKVRPFLCVLPDREYVKLNVNTLPETRAELLLVLGDNWTLEDVRNVLKARPKDGFQKDSFWTTPGMPAEARERKDLAGRISFDSEYFWLSASAVVGRGEARLMSLLQKQGEQQFAVVARTYSED